MGRICSVDGCERPHEARGWCALHYDRWRDHGTTDRRGPSIEERFWSKVDKTGTCWLWTATTTQGYGQFKVNGTMAKAHRVAYELLVGPIPDGLQLDHLCHNGSGCHLDEACPHRRCVNPLHLEPVTCKVNVLRGYTVSAAHARKTHCPYGHPYSGDNLGIRPSGKRRCLTCEKASSERRAASRRFPYPGSRP